MRGRKKMDKAKPDKYKLIAGDSWYHLLCLETLEIKKTFYDTNIRDLYNELKEFALLSFCDIEILITCPEKIEAPKPHPIVEKISEGFKELQKEKNDKT